MPATVSFTNVTVGFGAGMPAGAAARAHTSDAAPTAACAWASRAVTSMEHEASTVALTTKRYDAVAAWLGCC